MFVDDSTLLRHMLDAAKFALSTTTKYSLDDLLADELRVLGLEK